MPVGRRSHRNLHAPERSHDVFGEHPIVDLKPRLERLGQGLRVQGPCFTSATIPTIRIQRPCSDGLPQASRCPTGSPSRQKVRAMVSLMTMTGSDVAVSWAPRYRPRSSGIPSDSKYDPSTQSCATLRPTDLEDSGSVSNVKPRVRECQVADRWMRQRPILPGVVRGCSRAACRRHGRSAPAGTPWPAGSSPASGHPPREIRDRRSSTAQSFAREGRRQPAERPQARTARSPAR